MTLAREAVEHGTSTVEPDRAREDGSGGCGRDLRESQDQGFETVKKG